MFSAQMVLEKQISIL